VTICVPEPYQPYVASLPPPPPRLVGRYCAVLIVFVLNVAAEAAELNNTPTMSTMALSTRHPPKRNLALIKAQ
ncbi:MAG: hypothetical protein EBZ18_03280, partial [Alphaproteobacteria bacterium]|nr:hypothetical protein [Alphaproteobacteria bacterium]